MDLYKYIKYFILGGSATILVNYLLENYKHGPALNAYIYCAPDIYLVIMYIIYKSRGIKGYYTFVIHSLINYTANILVILLLILDAYFSIKKVTDYFSNSYDNIDAFIYINLEDREDRKTLLLDEFKKLDIPENKIRKISGVRIPKNGHKGCIQSHILALQMAKLNKWKRVIILEDDAELNVEPEVFKTMIEKAMEQTNWDMIILHGSNQTQKENSEINNGEMFYLKHSTQSTAYIINDNYYDKLLNLFIHCNDMMSKDNWEIPGSWESHALDQQWNKLVERDNWMGFKTNLLRQRNISSSINS